MTKVGWVGIGSMGRPMVERLARTAMTVKAYDSDDSRYPGLADLGIGTGASAGLLGFVPPGEADPAEVEGFWQPSPF